MLYGCRYNDFRQDTDISSHVLRRRTITIYNHMTWASKRHSDVCCDLLPSASAGCVYARCPLVLAYHDGPSMPIVVARILYSLSGDWRAVLFWRAEHAIRATWSLAESTTHNDNVVAVVAMQQNRRITSPHCHYCYVFTSRSILYIVNCTDTVSWVGGIPHSDASTRAIKAFTNNSGRAACRNHCNDFIRPQRIASIEWVKLPFSGCKISDSIFFDLLQACSKSRIYWLTCQDVVQPWCSTSLQQTGVQWSIG